MTTSLCAAIAGTINPSDFARFEELFKEAAVRDLLPKTASVLAPLRALASQPMFDAGQAVKKAEALLPERTDVVQLRPDGYGYVIKWAAAPDGTKPKEKKVSKEEAQQALPKKMLDTADQQGAATVTEVQAEPDPLVETPQPITGFGMYKVYEAGTGRQLIGYCIPGLFDPVQGGNSPMHLWFNGGQFALQPEINGVMVALSYNLPEAVEPRGMGVFYKTDGRGIIATVPYNILTRVQVEGREYYSATTAEGQEVQLTMSEGLQRPVAVSPQEVAIPADYSFLALDGQIQLDGGTGLEGQAAQDPMASKKQAAAPTMCEIRAWRNSQGPGGGVDLSGPVFSKHGSGTYDWVDGLFWLAAAGMPQNLALECMDKAASSGSIVRMYGLRPLSPREDVAHKTAAYVDAMADLSEVTLPDRPCLLKEALAIGHIKEARTLVGTDAIDNLLAVNFLNPENVRSFVEHIPQLEETSSKLAGLVFATQLGLQSVPKHAAVRAMECLEDVIAGLKALQEYKL